jgi:integrase
MAGKAKTLTAEQFSKVLDYVVRTSTDPFRDAVVLLLSFRAGLRVAEIAGLTWIDVTDAFGAVRTSNLEVPRGIAKKGSGRIIPMQPELHEGLCILKEAMGPKRTRPRDPIVQSSARYATPNVPMQPNSLQRYISRLYTSMGLTGCSSHSGRRTFTTETARIANKHGCSLKDVQRLVGHKFIDTTEGYIEPSDTVADLVGAL